VLEIDQHTAEAEAHSRPAPADHPEFIPIVQFGGLLHGPSRPESLSLETTGTTQQKPDARQGEFFNRQLLYKESVQAKLREVGCLDLADVLQGCHTIQSWAQCNGCKAVRTFWNRCENFFCPSCQPHLARDRYESIEWWANQIEQPKHVVLTARNTAAITQAHVHWFKGCLRRLRRSVFAKHWRGGCWSLEVTNEGRGWHLHAHLLVDARWIDEAELAIKWGHLVGQDFAIVKVKDARAKSYLKEVTKYAVKGSELAKWSGTDIAHFIHAFQGGKNFGTFGSLYGKRTKWREWLDSLIKNRGECECGCNDWEIFDADAWHLHNHRLRIIRGQPTI
jgi:hypothetical protein